MEQLDNGTLITLVTILVSAVSIVVGTLTPALVEGRAVLRALDGMTRQPEAGNDLRATLIVSLALSSFHAPPFLLGLRICFSCSSRTSGPAWKKECLRRAIQSMQSTDDAPSDTLLSWSDCIRGSHSDTDGGYPRA